MPSFGFQVQDMNFRFSIFGFKIWDSGSNVPDSGFRAPKLDFHFSIVRIWDSWSRVPGFGFGVQNLDFQT